MGKLEYELDFRGYVKLLINRCDTGCVEEFPHS